MSTLDIKADAVFGLEDIMAHTARTITPGLEEQIKDKYKTFTRFNYRDALKQSKLSRKKKSDLKNVDPDIQNAITNFILSLTSEPKKQNKNNKKILVVEQLAGVKSERRERFKRAVNILQIIRHYVEKQNFKPTEEESYLIKSLCDLKEFSQQSGLDTILKRIYKFMNEAVDFNQFRFLCLLVMLAADICLQFKDYNRAFYFYNEAKLFASYSELNQIKTESFIAMGLITMEIKLYSESVVIFKKALQYAWKTKSIESELLIYDYLGSAYYYQGKLKESQYYHKRFTQGEYEINDSAIKKISFEMLQQYEKHISSLQKKNLTSLFLEYINLPISDLTVVPTARDKKKIYDNYDQGVSPRKKKSNKKFQFEDFPPVLRQIDKLIKEDYQFRTQIPNPDVQRNFIALQKFGKARKNVVFEQSAEYHKIIGGGYEPVKLDELHSNSLQKRIQHALKNKDNPDWWGEMKDKIRKNQLQNVGQLRDKVFNSHQSYYKYPQERRRSYSLKTQKIKQSFNKTLLDWIDPPK